jgi:hypothetical protein
MKSTQSRFFIGSGLVMKSRTEQPQAPLPSLSKKLMI